ncbi:MAG: serine hydrolase [Myxococcaceae bacterium]
MLRKRMSWAKSFLLACVAANALAAGEKPLPTWPARLQRDIAALAKRSDGDIHLYVKELTSREEYGHNPFTPVYLASTIKVPVLLEVMRQVEAGTLKLDETLEYGPEDLRDGAGPVKRSPFGSKFPVHFLLDAMMGDSDNGATDLLMKRVGVAAVNEGLQKRGLQFGPITTLLDVRKRVYAFISPEANALTAKQIFDLWLTKPFDTRARKLGKMLNTKKPVTGKDLNAAFEAYYASNLNSAAMTEMGRLLEQLFRCEGLSVNSCALAQALMKACRTGGTRIRAGLPEDVVWAHKTGTQHKRACDVGLLFPTPDHTLVIAACVSGHKSHTAGDKTLAAIGKAVWSALGVPAPVPLPDAKPSSDSGTTASSPAPAPAPAPTSAAPAPTPTPPVVTPTSAESAADAD